MLISPMDTKINGSDTGCFMSQNVVVRVVICSMLRPRAGESAIARDLAVFSMGGLRQGDAYQYSLNNLGTRRRAKRYGLSRQVMICPILLSRRGAATVTLHCSLIPSILRRSV
ncbi:MAG: hypothetical protein GPOALKHO_000650 [Sodalis sp.]|nr:MAG: hypothetical protein GPOALKHO_000650 [Sodalis sp.]